MRVPYIVRESIPIPNDRFYNAKFADGTDCCFDTETGMFHDISVMPPRYLGVIVGNRRYCFCHRVGHGNGMFFRNSLGAFAYFLGYR